MMMLSSALNIPADCLPLLIDWVDAKVNLVLLLLVLSFYYAGWLSYRVQIDARARGLPEPSINFWSLVTLFCMWLGYPCWLWFRSRHPLLPKKEAPRPDVLCAECGEFNPWDLKQCRKCGADLQSQSQTREVKPEFRPSELVGGITQAMSPLRKRKMKSIKEKLSGVELPCPHCGELNPIGEKICSSCEGSLTGGE